MSVDVNGNRTLDVCPGVGVFNRTPTPVVTVLRSTVKNKLKCFNFSSLSFVATILVADDDDDDDVDGSARKFGFAFSSNRVSALIERFN